MKINIYAHINAHKQPHYTNTHTLNERHTQTLIHITQTHIHTSTHKLTHSLHTHTNTHTHTHTRSHTPNTHTHPLHTLTRINTHTVASYPYSADVVI